jgi:hypothetical protein
MSLNDPLSGAEIKQIIMMKVADALDRDCTLQDDICYPGFSLKFDAKIGYVRSVTPGTVIWGVENQGEPPANEEVVAELYETNSPNTAREENNLPIPVMIQTPAGPRREKVRFKKADAYGTKKK